MAQDFYATFGHDRLGQVGCDTLIYSHDFAEVQALIRENKALKGRAVSAAPTLKNKKSSIANLKVIRTDGNYKGSPANFNEAKLIYI